MHSTAFKKVFFDSPLFRQQTATKAQLERFILSQWSTQVTFITGITKLVGVVARRIAELALEAETEEEAMLKRVAQLMLPAVIDEMGLGRDPYGLMHHDLFAKQAEEFTGMTPAQIRAGWTSGPATETIMRRIEEAMGSVREGLHMMYVFETLAPGFFEFQERLFLNSGLCSRAIHATLHRASEEHHADEVGQYGELIELDAELIRDYIRLWRDYADELCDETFGVTALNEIIDSPERGSSMALR